MRTIILFCFLLTFHSLHARGRGISSEQLAEPGEFPWYTGPLLAGSGQNVPKGWGNIDLYNFVIDTYGTFNNHSHTSSIPTFIDENPFLTIQFGITDWMDISYNGGVNFQFSQDQFATRYGDTFIALGFQLMQQEKNSMKPDARLSITQEIPTGKFQNSNPAKKLTDLNGDGAFRTTIGLNFQKTFYGIPHHPCRVRWTMNYTYSAPVHVSGINAYGGAPDFHAKVVFDPIYQMIFAFEWTLTRHWAYAMDVSYSVSGAAKIKGGTSLITVPSIGDLPTPFSLSTQRSSYLSFTPSIEYNFSDVLGIIAGVWYSPWGLNSNQFIAYVVAFNYTFPASKVKKKQ